MPENDINYALGMPATPSTGAPAAGQDPAITAALRYKNGYRIAQLMNTMSIAVKIFGVVVGLIIFGLCMSAVAGPLGGGGSQASALFLTISVLCSVTAGGLFFILGVIVSVLGEHLKATLDSAVNTSPFLDLPAKARVMAIE